MDAAENYLEAEKRFGAMLTREQKEAYLELEALEGQRDTERVDRIHCRLKAVLPKYFWPLLAVAFHGEPQRWTEFQLETEDSLPEYI